MKRSQVQMRTSVVAVIAVVAAVAMLVEVGLSAHSPDRRARSWSSDKSFASDVLQPSTQKDDDAELTERLKTICDRAGGAIGVAVLHVETGRVVAIEGTKQLPLYSVFKLPLAIAVLKEVEENRLRLDQKVRITPAEAAPGWQGNSDLWRQPVDRSIRELLELSIVRSDNTSSDKLLQLVGGPEIVTQRMRALDLQSIEIRSSVRDFAGQRKHPNTSTANDLAHLLARLQQGHILQPTQLSVLLGFMEQATTGIRRLRGDLPAGTPVADKTGTGAAGSVTNDVGIITLPNGRGHLAMVVLLSGSKLTVEAQEKI
ncbi:MAG: class A beta-lactamase-related serine hydrolase, partial [Acidobacteriota bacterium]|nr:class A beta-lactamase-related serine hydrolase [Acidobacteriota bacterium]